MTAKLIDCSPLLLKMTISKMIHQRTVRTFNILKKYIYILYILKLFRKMYNYQTIYKNIAFLRSSQHIFQAKKTKKTMF